MRILEISIGACRSSEQQSKLDAYRASLRKSRGKSMNPEKLDGLVRMYSVIRIHNVVRTAVAKGLIQKGHCEVCGEEKVEGHHVDYNRPLDVVWLCVPHHKDWHKRHRPVPLEPDNCLRSSAEYMEMGLQQLGIPVAKLIRSLKSKKPRKE